jgi:nitrate reductase NapE component
MATRDWVVQEFHGTWTSSPLRRFATLEKAAEAINRRESKTYLHLRVVYQPAFYIGVGGDYGYLTSVYERRIRKGAIGPAFRPRGKLA